MKRVFSFLLCALLLAGAAAVRAEEVDLSSLPEDELNTLRARISAELASRRGDLDTLVADAVAVLTEGWREDLRRYAQPGQTYSLDIRGVRVIRIREDLEGKAAEMFGGVDCLVEFLMYDDYMSVPGLPGHNAGYLDLTGINSTVQVGRDGQMTLIKTSLISVYRSRTYETDYSGFIEEVIDLREAYDQVIGFTFP